MNAGKKEYLKKTLVDVGRNILKDQSYIYTEAEDKDMVNVIKQMMDDEGLAMLLPEEFYARLPKTMTLCLKRCH